MIIASPGGFVEGITSDNVLTAQPHDRNLALADALKRIGLAERTGRGVDRIFEASLKFGGMLPDYAQSTTADVVLSLPKIVPDEVVALAVAEYTREFDEPLSIEALFILRSLRAQPHSTLLDVAKSVGIDKNMAAMILDQLVARKVLTKRNEAGKPIYTLNMGNSEAAKVPAVQINVPTEMGVVETRIVAYLEQSGAMSSAELANMLELSKSQTNRVLHRLVDAGKVLRVVSGRYTKYRA